MFSPQKASPVLSMPIENLQTNSNNSSNQHSPCESTNSEELLIDSKKHCNECDAGRNRENLLRQELSIAQAEVESLKQLVQKFVGSILNQNSVLTESPEKPWIVSAK